MIKSMTGFGRCEIADEKRKFTVELKSVNHRYLDVNMKMPKKLNFFESAIRSLLKKYIERGKVDLYISYEDYTEDNYALKYNEGLAGEYLKYLNAMAETFHLENDVRVSTLSRYPDVFVMEEQEMDEEELWNGLQKAICGACEQFVETRIREGENLKKDLCEKLDDLLAGVDFIEERSPQTVAEYEQRLMERIKQTLAENDVKVDEQRVLTEVAVFADKVAVAEETVRLRSHFDQLSKFLEYDEPVGRKIDFIIQEMNRESNTIGSKVQDAILAHKVVDIKSEIEKIREQVQNIE